MGLFDLRCGVSRISTLWRARARERGTVSMFLVERIEERWLPWTPPIRGTYDRYGGIELWPEDLSAGTEWVGERLWSLWERGALVTSWSAELERSGARRASKVERVLKHGAETAYNAVKLTIEGRPAAACVVLDAVAAAIEGAAGPPLSSAAALAGWFAAGGAGQRHFADAPAELGPQLARYARVLAYAGARGGLTPIRSEDAGQHGDDDIRRSVRAAWAREEGPIRAMIEGAAPQWTRRWRARAEEESRAEAEAAALASASARAYAPQERYEVGEAIEHPRFGKGRVEALVEGNKIRVGFGGEARVLVHGLPRRS